MRIRPGSGGVLLSLLVVLLLLGAINYANALLFFLAFFLLGSGLVSALMAWRNLQGLTVSLDAAAPGFAGERLLFPVTVTAGSRDAEALQVRAGGTGMPISRIPANRTQAVTLPVRAAVRGQCHIGGLEIASEHPMGVLRVTREYAVDVSTLVYPRPVRREVPVIQMTEAAAEAPAPVEDELVGLRGCRPEDSPQRIAWKAVAAGRGWRAKEFATATQGGYRLELAAMPGDDLERRLALLCRGVLDAERAGARWLLDLNGEVYGPGAGWWHRARCLEALALYPASQK